MFLIAGLPLVLACADEDWAMFNRMLALAQDVLAAMGLAYHDPGQFLAAVRRDDRIAVQLFVAGRGLEA